ncbi:MAG: transposase [Alcanivoracaceae bacterium]|nr:transposase [Alcanivoracaceae bacterium]
MRKVHISGKKFKVALSALTGEKLSDICSRYEVSSSLVHKWKKQLKEQGSEIFNKNKQTVESSHTKELSKLYERIGQLTTELEFLKKVLGD